MAEVVFPDPPFGFAKVMTNMGEDYAINQQSQCYL